jgi:glycosyltransferase involved in cell wall biosynthesis
MNIFFMNRTGLAVWGGCEKWMLRTGIALRNKGHNVYFGGRKDSLFLQKCLGENFPTESFKVGSDFNAIIIRKLTNYFKKHNINIIINERNQDIRFTGLAKMLNGERVLVARTGLPSIKNNLSFRFIFPKLIDGIVVTTQAIKDKYLTYNWMKKQNIRVIHDGILPLSIPTINESDLKEKFDLPPDRPIIGIFGNLIKLKQHRVFLEVAAKLLEKQSNLIFIIVGDGPERSNIEKFAVKLGIIDQIYLLGYQEDTLPLYRMCDLVLLTSQQEGIPNTIMEAMMMEKPVIAFDVGGISELIVNEKNGILIPPNDIYVMTQKAIQLIEDKRRMDEMGKIAREHILSNYSFQNMVIEIENYLQELIERKNR